MYTYQSPAALRLRFPTLIHCSLCPPKSFPNSLTLSAQILAADCKYPCVPLYLWARISLWFPHRALGLSPISPPLPPPPASKRNHGQEWFLWYLWFCLAVLVMPSSQRFHMVLSSSQWFFRFCPTANVRSALSSSLLLYGPFCSTASGPSVSFP
jgi:hypothetical protein